MLDPAELKSSKCPTAQAQDGREDQQCPNHLPYLAAPLHREPTVRIHTQHLRLLTKLSLDWFWPMDALRLTHHRGLHLPAHQHAEHLRLLASGQAAVLVDPPVLEETIKRVNAPAVQVVCQPEVGHLESSREARQL